MPTITPEDCYPEGVPVDFPVEMFAPIDAESMVTRDLVLQQRIDEFQDWMLTLPQTECPVANLFGGGVYARQVFIPKGTVAIGAIHLDEHINLVLQGDVTMLTVDGPKRVKAPAMFVAPPGSKKFGYANEDTLWVTVQPAISDDPDEIVALTTVKRFDEYRSLLARGSFQALLGLLGVTDDAVRAESENESTYLAMVSREHKFVVDESSIEGRGVMASDDIAENEVIGPCMIDGKRTQLGRFVNHSNDPNAAVVFSDGFQLVALRKIERGDEIVTNYVSTLRCVKENTQCLP